MNELYIVVHSGLCNKLIPLISLLRISIIENKKLFCYWKNECMGLNKVENGYHFLDLFEEISNIEFICEKEIILFKKNKTEFYDDKKCKSIYNKNISLYDKITHPISFPNDNIDNVFKPMPTKTIDINYNPIHKKFILDFRKFLKQLKPLTDIQQKINYFINENNFNQNILGIHIRSIDGGFKYFKKENSIKYIDKFIHTNPNWKVFVSTDNIIIENKIKNKFKDKILHFDNPFGKTYDEKFIFNSHNGLKNSICDLFILSKCNKIIGTKSSSFSLMAFLLSNNNILEYW